jgi:hypothetical protein
MDTARGGDITNGSADRMEGRCLDLEMDLADLPPWGRLCLSERNVTMMAMELGMAFPDPEVANELEALRQENADLRAHVDALREVLTTAPRLQVAQGVIVLSGAEPVPDNESRAPVTVLDREARVRERLAAKRRKDDE